MNSNCERCWGFGLWILTQKQPRKKLFDRGAVQIEALGPAIGCTSRRKNLLGWADIRESHLELNSTVIELSNSHLQINTSDLDIRSSYLELGNSDHEPYSSPAAGTLDADWPISRRLPAHRRAPYQQP